MNREINKFLMNNLEEAHNTFIFLIEEMKKNNILFSYDILEVMEMNSYREIKVNLAKMNYYLYEYKSIKEDNRDIFDNEYLIYIKYISLYIVSLLLIKLTHKIFDKVDFNDIMKYLSGMLLGSTYIGLLNKDLSDNRSDTKEKRDLINELKTMKEEYHNTYVAVVNELDSMFALNNNLWDKLNEEKSKKILKKKY